MQRKWFIASLLVLAELLVLGGIIISSRSGLNWQSVLGLRFGPRSNAFSAQGDEDQSFGVSGAASLDVVTPVGAVTITGGTGSELKVHAHKTGWGSDQAGADAALAALNVIMTQTGDAITIKVEEPAEFQLGGEKGGSVDFTIEVPTATAIRAHSDFGAVTLEHVAATTIKADSSSGSVSLTDVAATGPVALKTDFGEVAYAGGRAASLDARTSSGRVTLTGLAVDGAVTAHSDFGRVHLAQVAAGGAYDASSSSGEVSVDGATGQIKAHTDFGSVSVIHAVAATISLHSSSGAVSFSGSLGAGPHSLTTDFGDVRLTLPADTKANVDLSTSFGRIHSALPITLGTTADVDEAHWVGVLNGGGPQITAQTSSGGITLEPLKS